MKTYRKTHVHRDVRYASGPCHVQRLRLRNISKFFSFKNCVFTLASFLSFGKRSATSHCVSSPEVLSEKDSLRRAPLLSNTKRDNRRNKSLTNIQVHVGGNSPALRLHHRDHVLRDGREKQLVIRSNNQTNIFFLFCRDSQKNDVWFHVFSFHLCENTC